MDIILDSNIFLGDVRFRKTQFPELFAYLRRAGSALVLPDLVLQEVRARYPEMLNKDIRTAKSSWGSVSAMMLTDYPPFPDINVQKEVELFVKRMHSPGQGVQVIPYSRVDKIDVNEIARRGIQRLPPANSNGEELRDVILWLVVVQYAKTTGRDVAFISGDHGFRRSKSENELHPDLQDEIRLEELPIYFYHEISAFLRAHSLSHDAVDELWVSQYITQADLAEKIRDAMLVRSFPSLGVPKEARIDRLSLLSGVRYEVSKNSMYGELKFQADVTLTSPYSTNFIDDSTLQNSPPFFSNPWRLQGPAAYSPNIIVGSGVYSANVMPASAVYSPNVFATTVFPPNLTAEIRYDPVPDIVQAFRFEISISLRIQAGKLEEWQVDEVRLQ